MALGVIGNHLVKGKGWKSTKGNNPSDLLFSSSIKSQSISNGIFANSSKNKHSTKWAISHCLKNSTSVPVQLRWSSKVHPTMLLCRRKVSLKRWMYVWARPTWSTKINTQHNVVFELYYKALKITPFTMGSNSKQSVI